MTLDWRNPGRVTPGRGAIAQIDCAEEKMIQKAFDIVIIGAGPNGLELGAYLSKAGLKVLLLEKRLEIGGGLATEEVTLPGYFHNTHAVYMMMADYAPIYSDLKFEEELNVKHIYPPLQFALPLSDGKCVCIYSDPERTFNSIARFSKHDADSYRDLYHRCRQAVDDFIAPATYVPAVPTLDQVVKLQQSDIGREISEYAEKSPKEIIDEYFENEHVKALMLYVATQWGIGYDQSGVGYLVLLYLDRATSYRLVVGGSHMVSQALYKTIYQNGGVVLNSQRIKRIIVSDGAAHGVEIDDGTVFQANKAVVSTIDPSQTFLQLVGEENLDGDFAEKVKGWM
jgi:phytoene dehydrogenase-like protein